MAIVDDLSRTILPLDDFRRFAGIEPYHFWQMRGSSFATIECAGDCWKHWSWTDRRIGRLDLIDAIESAEKDFADVLDYWPGPKYDEETVRLQKPTQSILYNLTPFKLFTKYHNIRQVGKLTYTDISLGFNIVPFYDATDNVMFTVTVAATTTECEVIVAYAGTTVEIRPIDVSISGTTATIIIKKWLLGNPDNWDGECFADDVSNLLQTVDVYRRWYDVADQITMAWEPGIRSCNCSVLGTCQICVHNTCTACALQGDYAVGAVAWQLATYIDDSWSVSNCSSCGHQNRWPDLAYVNYLHGADPGVDCNMARDWKRLVTILAVTNLYSAPCDCDNVINFFRYWREDLSKSTEERTYSLGSTDMEGLFGKLRGQVHAMRAVKRRLGERY